MARKPAKTTDEAEQPSAQAPVEQVSRADIERQLALLERKKLALRARADLLFFTKMTMPDPSEPDALEATRYKPARHHEVLAAALEAAERGEMPRLIVCMPPRGGKSELVSRRFLAWYLGRDPYRSVIFATYNEDFAMEFGRDVRTIVRSPQYQQIFPGVEITRGASAANQFRLSFNQLSAGGARFSGTGGSLTGRGGHVLVLDDPFKDREEADSPTIREKVWSWFTQVFMTRQMPGAIVVIVMCMTGDTPVLMATGREKPLRDIRPGDRVATYEDGKITTSTVRNWANQGPDRVFTIRMKSGAVVRANARHPFLVYEDGKEVWRRTDLLRAGSAILRATGESGAELPVAPRDATSRRSAGACAPRTTTRIAGGLALYRLRSTLSLVARRACAIVTELTSRLTSGCWPSRAALAPFAGSRQPGATLAPIGMGSSAWTAATKAERSGDFSATIATLPSATEKPETFFGRPLHTLSVTHDTVVEIFESGVEDVFDIQVERTENFIANGLASHNTRWHEDDVVGRLTDPENPHYDPEEAANWKIINFPMEAEDNDPLGRQPGDLLWPERFGPEFVASQKRLDPRGYMALYQQRPTPEDGSFFRREWIVQYTPRDLPKNLRVYAASDHAVGTKQTNDRTAMLIVGVDEHDDIWVLDAVWDRIAADKQVSEMIRLMKKHEPMIWWAEKGHISKSIGPFLRKRMSEEKVYGTVLHEETPIADKQARAQSIAGRMSMKKVRFPRHAPWLTSAISELMKFPLGSHDDFVDALAWIGLGLRTQVKATKAAPPPKLIPATGTIGWIKWAAKRDAEQATAGRGTKAGW